MARVSQDNAANLSATAAAPTKAQVEDRIANIEAAYTKGVDELADGGLFDVQTEAEANGEKSIRALRPAIDKWAARGRLAAASGKRYTEVFPGSNGWPGWTSAGDEFKKGINAIVDIGDHATLKAIVETVKEAPATTAKAIVDASKVVQQAGSNIALGVLKPVLVALGAYVVLRMTVLR